MRDRADRIAHAEERAIRLHDPGSAADTEDRARADAGRVDRRKQDVRVGVADVVIAAKPRAQDVLAVALQVVDEANAGLPVVLVFLRRETELPKETLPFEPSGRADVLQL